MNNSLPTVVNLYKSPYDIYIGRGSKWGNLYSHLPGTLAPFTVLTREEAIQCYEVWIRQQPALLAQLHTLDGKVLGCFCKPKACHGDILIKIRMEQLGITAPVVPTQLPLA